MNEKIDAKLLFTDIFTTDIDENEQIEIWNARCEIGNNEEFKIYHLNESELDEQFGSGNMKGEPYKLSVYDIIALGFDVNDDYFINGVYPESFSSKDLSGNIFPSEIFEETSVWEDKEIYEKYCNEIAALCKIEGNNYIFSDFIREQYDITKIPTNPEQIRKDWEKYNEE